MVISRLIVGGGGSREALARLVLDFQGGLDFGFGFGFGFEKKTDT